ncbi:SDR family NAD(P)-dependent oxidoreductase [Meridianimarinicoccus aquatilis]|uniref:SDR family oxidoreductase n=1 Tax=Meridianimarinicoccus aquatilis TaxID=2552766 RepID=A0A4R6B5N9_9RHOB|nr:SDR family oxidoreductase [Fluviibacterium aquatile]QIE40625.1 SDR family oxidoreductase [Rhodobacteraceae bacterium SC52]TDL91133.1 SDR family oxidoreductase [Fluviibacterium aquatile]
MTRHARFPDLDGASVFVTGGGSGIGAAFTDGLMAQGAKVAFVQRSDGTAFCDAMERAHGTRPLFLPCDITDTPALQAAIAQAAAQHGDIDVLVNNAANDKRHSTMEVDEAFWDWSQAINLKSYFFAAQSVLPGMRKAGRGSIVNLSSISYMMGNAGYPAYTTANGGITALTRSLAREFGPDGIRVNALAPGWVFTEKQIALWATEEGVAAHLARQCLPRMLKPDEMVEPLLFLASEASRAMTGQAMAVDGGVVVSG